MEQLISYVKYNKVYIAIIVVIIIVLFFSYKLLYSVRTRNSVKAFENKYSDFNTKIKRNFYTTKFQNYSLADFHISSSYNPFLTGYLKYDYASINMIKKVITYGARYIELEIFNKNIRNSTVPVVGMGIENTQQITTQNTLDCKEVFTVIKERIFSEKYIDNYTDPFFIFLNLKTDNNISTLNILYDQLISIFNDSLLGPEYSYQKINIANTPMYKFMNKIIILSSDGYKHSKLEELINLSTTNSNLSRVNYEDLPTRKEMIIKKDAPIINMESTKIKFSNNVISILDGTNFTDIGINSKLVLIVKNALNQKNNTPNNTFLTIEEVTDKSIFLNDTIKFTPETSEATVNLQFFTKEFMLSNLPEKNKSTLTIVYTNNIFFNNNYDFSGAFALGCQFVCMNFQNQDKSMDKYIKKFNKNSIIPKPSNLRNDKDWYKNSNITENYGASNAQQQKVKNKPTILTDFISNFTTVSILPFNTSLDTECCVNKIPSNTETNCSKHKTKINCISDSSENCNYIEDINKCNKNLIKVIVKKTSNSPYLVLSPNFNNSNSFFDIEEGLNRQPGAISIKYKHLYLVTDYTKDTDDNSCYLTFETLPSNDKEDDKFNLRASFYPVAPKCNKTNYISFMQLIKNTEYYIKYRSEYDYNFKLYKKEINFDTLELVGDVTVNNSKLNIFQVKATQGYKSIGSILLTTNSTDNGFTEIYKKKNTFFMYKGATSAPIDFKIITTFDKYTVWKAIPSSGFVALGVIVTLSGQTPEAKNFCCISLNFLKKQINEEDSIWNNNNIDNPISFWPSTTSTYFKISTTSDENSFIRPNEFIEPFYIIEDSGKKPKNLLERLFIEKLSNVASKDLDNTCFRIIQQKLEQKNVEISEETKTNFKSYNKKIKYTNSDTNETKCIGLDNIYWTKFFGDKYETTPELKLVDCKSNAYIGTNFDLNEDGTIRLTSNKNFCITNKDNKLILSECDLEKNKQNQTFIYDKLNKKLCNSSNQCISITDNSISLGTDGHSNIIISKIKTYDSINVNDAVLYKQLIPRGDINKYLTKDLSDNSNVFNFLSEVIDTNFFHVYSLGIVKNITQDDITVHLYTNNLEYEPTLSTTSRSPESTASPSSRPPIDYKKRLVVNANTNKLIKKKNITIDKLKPGTKVLCKNKGINHDSFEDQNYVYWMATIINNEQIKDGYVTILFSINSIEPNQNRNSKGRPRTNNPIFAKISDLILLNNS